MQFSVADGRAHWKLDRDQPLHNGRRPSGKNAVHSTAALDWLADIRCYPEDQCYRPPVMPKGFYSQGVTLLTDGSTTLSDVKSALQKHGFKIARETAAPEHWQLGGATLVVPYRPEINGYVAVDLVNEQWPDTMGDPKADSMTFGAWSMGHFGPWAYPHGLRRAGQHAWAWEPASGIADGHAGFIRIRLSYLFGAEQDSPVLPESCDALDELDFVGRIVLAALEAPGVLCYFNPNGEVLRDRASFSEMWNACVADKVIALPLWSNIRFFNLSDLMVMDTVGNAQFDAMDIEAIFPESCSPQEVDGYLRNVTLYLVDSRPQFESGESIDGPGEQDTSWTLEVLESGLTSPPRQILRLYPKRDADAVRRAVDEVSGGA
jgi:hypothetical protein